ncbi:ATP synthase subunit b chloroplastic [Phtheirospermum japonicum]|uniref:ATP synthase subunit b chloroplastic n=1 Tax=Phtheirospermum japonicum TaxID=374723 RepID=A0A830D7U5_9LAMI|nr:ATP synthase subunit b chloroplastic [Phtheirospermum japonicum]
MNKYEECNHSFVYIGHLSIGNFGFNIDILVTYLINLNVVIDVLIFFIEGMCMNCLFQ